MRVYMYYSTLVLADLSRSLYGYALGFVCACVVEHWWVVRGRFWRRSAVAGTGVGRQDVNRNIVVIVVFA